VERIPERYTAWAHDSGRLPARAVAAASRAPVLARVDAPTRAGRRPPRIAFPTSQQRFALDVRVSPSQAELLLRAEADPSARVRFEVDGQGVCEVGAPFACPWPLQKGQHRLVVRAGTERSAPLEFSVE
jgi:hypothetical protein